MKRAVPWVTERNQCAIYCCVSSKVTHRMRVRLTVRYRTFERTVCQVLFVVWSHIRDPPRASDHRGSIREKGPGGPFLRGLLRKGGIPQSPRCRDFLEPHDRKLGRRVSPSLCK